MSQWWRRIELDGGSVLAGVACIVLCLAALPWLLGTGAADQTRLLVHTERLFDGGQWRIGESVLIEDGRVLRVGPRDSFADERAPVLDLGDASVLPGFIELHAHVRFQNVAQDVLLEHGITTARDLGGLLERVQKGPGQLRLVGSGPILTVAGGYPAVTMGEHGIARLVDSPDAARLAVQDALRGGAALIKIALEPGGEAGAPWSMAHGHGAAGSHASAAAPVHDPHATAHAPLAQEAHDTRAAAVTGTVWPMPDRALVQAVVDEAHRLGLKVSAHIGEELGARLALETGVDEWAHVPCAPLPEEVIARAAAQQVAVIGTLDTLSSCAGTQHNATRLVAAGVALLYGAEVAHPDIPWGIDVQELQWMMAAGMSLDAVLQAATSRAGAHLGIPLLGTLQEGAPADLIAIRGDVATNLKHLEYPELVIAGGQVVHNLFVP